MLIAQRSDTIHYPFFDSGLMWASGPNADFGEGVYFGDPTEYVLYNGIRSLDVNPGVSCPPSYAQQNTIVEAYNLEDFKKPEDITAYLDVEFLRSNWFGIVKEANTQGNFEIIVKEPLMPLPNGRKGLIIDGVTAQFNLDSSCW